MHSIRNLDFFPKNYPKINFHRNVAEICLSKNLFSGFQADEIYLSPLPYPTHTMPSNMNAIGQPMMPMQSPIIQPSAVKVLRR